MKRMRRKYDWKTGRHYKVKKCRPEDHSPGILSLSNKHLVCDICDEVFDWEFLKNGKMTTVEFGEWPGQPQPLKDE